MPSGFDTGPQSCATTRRLAATLPVVRSTSISATIATYPLSPSYTTHEMPRPAARPATGISGLGDGRGTQCAAFTAAVSTSLSRGSLRWRNRYATGSDRTWAATSSMMHSCANVFCKRDGDRNGPVKNGEATVCVRTRSLVTVPAPPAVLPTRPDTYDGAA